MKSVTEREKKERAHIKCYVKLEYTEEKTKPSYCSKCKPTELLIHKQNIYNLVININRTLSIFVAPHFSPSWLKNVILARNILQSTKMQFQLYAVKQS